MKSKLNIIIIILVGAAFYAYKKLESSYKKTGKDLKAPIAQIADENTNEQPSLFNPDIYYFLPIDRYVDGDSLNNTNVDLENPLGFHGGDIKGIISNFDEIQSLGVTKIILTSVQKQIDSSYEIKNSAGKSFQVTGFEGSSVDDFKEFETRLGDMNDLKNLVNLAHDNNIKILLSFNGKEVNKDSSLLNSPDTKEYFLEKTTSEICNPNNTKTRNSKCVTNNSVNLNQEDPTAVQSTLDFLVKVQKETSIDGVFIEDAHRYSETYLSALKERVPGKFEILFDYRKEIVQLINEDIKQGVATHFTSYFGFYTLASYLNNKNGNYNVDTIVNNFNIISNLRATNLVMMFSYLRGRSPYYQYGENISNLKICLVLGALQNTSMMITMGDEIVREDSGFPSLLSNMRFHDKTIKPNSPVAPDTEIRKFYQRLIQAKLNYPILSNGVFNKLYFTNDLLVLEKKIAGTTKRALVIINKYFNPQNLNLTLPEGYQGLTSNEITSGEDLVISDNNTINLSVKPQSIQVHIFD
jgi:glycosidase